MIWESPRSQNFRDLVLVPMTEHVPKHCDITGCREEASYWIDTAEGFIENLLKTQQAVETFYLCLNHQSDLMSHGDNDGFYVHLRIDTGEIKFCAGSIAAALKATKAFL
jgi:hypothetical protein